MTMALVTAMALARQCAPAVAPETLLAVAHAESGFNPLAINVNGAPSPAQPTDKADAVETARALIDRGYSVDLGISQINSRNLRRLGMTIADAFDPCRNFAGAATILTQSYSAASRRYTPDVALGVALSLYNSGDTLRGYHNGYVARVYRSAATVMPAINTTTGPATQTGTAPALPSSRSEPPAASMAAEVTAPPAWDVFAASQHSSILTFGSPAQ